MRPEAQPKLDLRARRARPSEARTASGHPPTVDSPRVRARPSEASGHPMSPSTEDSPRVRAWPSEASGEWSPPGFARRAARGGTPLAVLLTLENVDRAHAAPAHHVAEAGPRPLELAWARFAAE